MDDKKDKERLSIYETWWKHLIAGSMGGIVSRSCTAPLDRLKVFAQVTGEFYHPVWGLVKIVKKDGFFSLWRGNGINMMKITPETASKFLIYEYAKLLMGAEHESLTIWERFICAACAGIFSQTLIYPIEVLKTRMVIREGRNSVHSLKNVYKTLIRNKGHIGLFQGYFSTIVGIILFTGTDLCTYEKLNIGPACCKEIVQHFIVSVIDYNSKWYLNATPCQRGEKEKNCVENQIRTNLNEDID